MKLTERQRRFADEYIKTANAEHSALKAGYSETYSRKQSHKLLANVGIKTYIDERLDVIKSNEIAEQKEILAYLTKVMRGEETDTEVIPVTVGKGVQKIEHVTKKVNSNVRVKSAELLGKRYGLWIDKERIEKTIAEKRLIEERTKLYSNTENSNEHKIIQFFDNITNGNLYSDNEDGGKENEL